MVQQAAHRRQQLVDGVWLGQHGDGVQLLDGARLVADVARGQDDAHVGANLSQALHHLDAGHARHRQVDDHQIDHLGLAVKHVHRVGADEFAAILAGPVDRIELPKPGHWVRQGQKVISLYRGDAKIEMISPVEGEVVEVNAELANNPHLLREDPYGQGWLMSVFAPDEEGPTRNLLPANLLSSWMKEAADGFYGLQPQLAGATAADGGRPSKDATADLPVDVWHKAAKQYLLS